MKKFCDPIRKSTNVEETIQIANTIKKTRTIK